LRFGHQFAKTAHHAQASEAKVIIQKLNGAVRMKISDDGKGFQAAVGSNGRSGKQLGLLGMRERLEMVGGKFMVTSAPGRGTTICVEIPLADGSRRRTFVSKTKSTLI
jgi:signal transduction histidine kinase